MSIEEHLENILDDKTMSIKRIKVGRKFQFAIHEVITSSHGNEIDCSVASGDTLGGMIEDFYRLAPHRRLK